MLKETCVDASAEHSGPVACLKNRAGVLSAQPVEEDDESDHADSTGSTFIALALVAAPWRVLGNRHLENQIGEVSSWEKRLAKAATKVFVCAANDPCGMSLARELRCHSLKRETAETDGLRLQTVRKKTNLHLEFYQRGVTGGMRTPIVS